MHTEKNYKNLIFRNYALDDLKKVLLDYIFSYTLVIILLQ